MLFSTAVRAVVVAKLVIWDFVFNLIFLALGAAVVAKLAMLGILFLVSLF